MQWFRFYSEVLNDPKVQSLEPELFKHWINLLCVSCNNNGTLPETFQQIAFHLRVSDNDTITLLERLHNATLIDRVNGGANGYRYAIHGWNKRQYKSDTSTERVKRFRSVSRNVTETPPEQIQKQIQNIKNNTIVLSKKRGTRLPYDWELEQHEGEWALKKGMTFAEVKLEEEKFKDYWVASGKVKVDWSATWRNWIRSAIERKAQYGIRK